MKYPKLNRHFTRSGISAETYVSNTSTFSFITISKSFSQVIFYTHTMPSAPAETTTFPETEWAPSETSELSCKYV